MTKTSNSNKVNFPIFIHSDCNCLCVRYVFWGGTRIWLKSGVTHIMEQSVGLANIYNNNIYKLISIHVSKLNFLGEKDVFREGIWNFSKGAITPIIHQLVRLTVIVNNYEIDFPVSSSIINWNRFTMKVQYCHQVGHQKPPWRWHYLHVGTVDWLFF